jgi:type VI secretion system protein ImpM
MVQFGLPQQADNVPAWFGKLPGIGDFAQRRLEPDFLKLWDNWLQNNLRRLRDQRDDWMVHYLEAPLWYFALGCDIVNANPWVGILMPSVDAVGRYFPLTLAIELQACESEVLAHEEMGKIQSWWACSADAALMALDTNQDAIDFDAALCAAFNSKMDPSLHVPKIEQLPLSGSSIWLANIAERQDIAHEVDGLPKDNVFEFLFGYSDITT